MDKTKGWKTRAAAYLIGAYAIIGMGIYVIGSPESPGAVSPAEGIPLALGSFGLYGIRDAVGKMLANG